ncbi:MAG: heparinase II/III family protein [bacterium]
MYYIKRMWQLGPSGLAQTLKRRFTTTYFAVQHKQKALTIQTYHTWGHKNFTSFFQRLKNQDFLKKIYCSELFQKHLPNAYSDTKTILIQADKAANNTFNILESGDYCFEKTIDWHHDFKTKPFFQKFSRTFYQDITIPSPKSSTQDQYHPDIKVPWELSRFQHLFWLGKAYEITNNQTYVKAFENQINHWIDSNPFLLGVNWVCPMEVAIRAINWIWGFYFFKDAQILSPEFWEKCICSLYDHAIYLENNWETSDKPNNHYLSDLIGYYYLCHFFAPLKCFNSKLMQCYKTLHKQCHKQILPDGACYEGSTAYHRLDTEIILHTTLVTKACTIFPSQEFETIFAKMLSFLSNCTDHAGNLVLIGDNDSGKLITGIVSKAKDLTFPQDFTEQNAHSDSTTTHSNFGLSIIKDNTWYITLRHPTYSLHQPSGHFHNDQLAITLSINGQSLFVDPGTYAYTANPYLRNLLRSHASHNTFYTTQGSQQNCHDLFQLPRPSHKPAHTNPCTSTVVQISDWYHNMHTPTLTFHRTITYDTKQKKLIIQDWIESQEKKPHQIAWTFLIAPGIMLQNSDKNRWLLMAQDKPLAVFSSQLLWTPAQHIYAPAYGVKQSCTSLTATMQMHPKTVITTIITDISPTAL